MAFFDFLNINKNPFGSSNSYTGLAKPNYSNLNKIKGWGSSLLNYKGVGARPTTPFEIPQTNPFSLNPISSNISNNTSIVSAQELPNKPVVTPQVSNSAGGGYTVQSGDTLSTIASKNGMTLSSLLALNPQFQANPNLIRPGQSVNLGGVTTGLAQATPQLGGATAPILGGATNTQTPAIPDLSKFQSEYDTASKNYQDLLKLSPEELSTQADLDKLIESTKTAYQNTSNQAIPLEFITGQTKAIENRALGLKEPLEAKLARLQAQRMASLEGSKFALEKAKSTLDEEKRKRDELLKPKEVSEGQKIVKFNPTTGQYEEVFNYPKSKTSGTDIKDLTVDQSKARGFATSALNANNILANNKYDLGNFESSLVPNALKSQDRQEFEQASRAFVNAVLRRESGATITDSEFLNKQKELIPQAGDSAGVLAQKKAARDAAVRSLQESGLMSPQSFTTNLNTGSSSTNDAYLKSLGF